MNRFLDVFLEQKVIILIDGQVQEVDRAALGLHLHLSRLTEMFLKVRDQGDVQEMHQIIVEYLSQCKVKEGSGLEMLNAFYQIQMLNQWQWELPFMSGTDKPKVDIPYDYNDRNWALWIHKLATRYGWTREQIFNLWPEEAACYMQEILVSEFQEYEEVRVLSEVSYKYDRFTKTSKYIDLPKPDWMQSKAEDLPIYRVRRSILPVGDIYRGEEKVTYH